VAQAQDAAPAAAPSANQSSTKGAVAPPDTSKSAGAPQGGSSQAASALAGAAQPGGTAQGATGGPAPGSAPNGASAGPSGKPPAVCFKLTGRCVEQKKAPATKGGTAATQTGSAAKRPLNLAAPDVRTVVPAEELKEPLPSNDQITEVQEPETVQVKTDQGVPPDVPGGFGALWWAVNHPSQAWRILTPAE
jgi:hypothetical protein